MTVVPFAISAFTTMLVVVDPIAVLPVFFAMTANKTPAERGVVFRRAVLIAFGVAAFFLIAGRFLLSQIGVTADAFKISGGILLFLTAVPMLFGHRGGLMAPDDNGSSASDGDIAVFPLAIPLISGAGMMTTVLTLEAAATGSDLKQGALCVALILVFLTTAIVLRLGTFVLAKLGPSGANIVTRFFGIILAALAAQFVLNGITGFLKVHS